MICGLPVSTAAIAGGLAQVGDFALARSTFESTKIPRGGFHECAVGFLYRAESTEDGGDDRIVLQPRPRGNGMSFSWRPCRACWLQNVRRSRVWVCLKPEPRLPDDERGRKGIGGT